MSAAKQYADAAVYEKKFEKVMERFGVEKDKYNWDHSRRNAWVEFFYKGQLYRFEHSVENAQAHGQKLTYGTDAFAQIVLALEDLVRISNRGIYDLQTWVMGMCALPEKRELPDFCGVLGLDHLPTSEQDIQAAYYAKVKESHPDAGGSSEEFTRLTDARNKALEYLKNL